MTKDELISAVNFLFEEEKQKQIVFYCIDSSKKVKMLNINSVLLSELLKDFTESIRERIVEEVYDIQEYTAADRRKGSYYRYDLPEEPAEFSFFTEVLGQNIPMFNFDDGWINQIKKLVIVISSGDQRVILYKDISGVEKYLKQGKYFMLMKCEDRFDKIPEDILGVNNKFQMMKVGNDILILNMESIEKNFSLNQVIRNEAERGKERVQSLISDMAIINQMCDDDSSFQKKIIATKHSFVYTLKDGNGNRIIIDAIILDYIRNNPDICGTFSFDDNGKVVINNKSKAKRFVKVLNEDYLKSGLTNIIYDAFDKKRAEG